MWTGAAKKLTCQALKLCRNLLTKESSNGFKKRALLRILLLWSRIKDVCTPIFLRFARLKSFRKAVTVCFLERKRTEDRSISSSFVYATLFPVSYKCAHCWCVCAAKGITCAVRIRRKNKGKHPSNVTQYTGVLRLERLKSNVWTLCYGQYKACSS